MAESGGGRVSDAIAAGLVFSPDPGGAVGGGELDSDAAEAGVV